MSRITLELPDAMASQLAEAGRETSRTPEQVAQDMLKRMLAVRKFNKLRQEVLDALGPDAPATEDEIFEQIS